MDVEVVVGGASLGEQAAVERLFHDWEGVFSRFRPGSELNHVNASEASIVAVSPLFAHVLRMALAAAASTDGLVDPTLGGAIVASGYDRDFAQLGDDARPAGAAAPGRWRAVRLSGQLVSRRPCVHLDLNGFVKAHAVDRALSFLAGDGFVAAGGDVAVRGSAVVGLPGEGSVRLGGGGVATSGTTRRHWLRGGERQHHLIDPRTGRPALSRWTEVTAAAPTCLDADVAAKAAFLLSDDGPDWLDERGLPGRFLDGERAVTNRAWGKPLPEAA